MAIYQKGLMPIFPTTAFLNANVLFQMPGPDPDQHPPPRTAGDCDGGEPDPDWRHPEAHQGMAARTSSAARKGVRVEGGGTGDLHLSFLKLHLHLPLKSHLIFSLSYLFVN